MKVPSNYKPAGDNDEGATLLTGAQSYSKSVNQYLKEQQTKRQLFMDAIFCPDWDRLSARPSGTIQSLVAQSLGLVPELAKPDIIELHALPYFDAQGDLLRVNMLKAFLRRLADAKENIAPLGDLKPIAGYEDNEDPRFRKADFIELAKRMHWDLPEGFSRIKGMSAGPKPKAAKSCIDDRERSSQLHCLIWRVYQYLLNKSVKVTARQVWNEIQHRYKDHDKDEIIQEVTTESIAWCSCYGNEQTFKRTTLNKTLSNLKADPPF
jgi:hypothetical protein